MTEGATRNIDACLVELGIPREAYVDVIRALFLAASKDPRAHAAVRYDGRDCPAASVTVTRRFDRLTVVAGDRGAIYGVWVMRTDENGRTEELIAFERSPASDPAPGM